METDLKNAFKDESLIPTTERIKATLGATYKTYAETVEELEGKHDLSMEWRHYRDGGWLCKCVKGKKNLAWICINEGVATLACYFSARHRCELLELELPPELLNRVRNAEMIGKTLPVVVELRDKQDKEAALKVVEFKKTSK